MFPGWGQKRKQEGVKHEEGGVCGAVVKMEGPRGEEKAWSLELRAPSADRQQGIGTAFRQ